MEVLVITKTIANSVKTLKSMTNNFASYTEPKQYSPDDQLQYEELLQAIDFINGGISQIASGKNELNALITQAKEDYNNLKSKEERKNFLVEFEKIENETNFNDVIASATEMIYMLNTRLTEARSNKTD